MCDLICGGYIGFYSFTPVARLVSYENRKCGPENMNVFAKFDEIPSMTLQDIKETKRYGHTFVRSDGRENSIPSHKHSLRGV